jgi:ectoine hydroxylase-related dioxygenase (phytanoyl-CoA dioxygenase family)
MSTASLQADPRKLEEFHETGWTIIDDVLSPAEVAVHKAELIRCIDEDLEKWKGREYQDTFMVYALMTRASCFAEFLENSVLHTYVDAVLGDTCLVNAFTSSSMPPNGTNYSNRIHVDAPRFIPGYVTNIGFLVALTDFTFENGAMSALPGSAKSGDRPTDEEYDRKALRIYPKAGQGIFFNARVWHRGERNMTAETRHAITLNCCRSYMRTQFDYPRMVSKEIVDSLGEVGRRFLGFNVRMPTSLDEYYVPADQRLYKANQG